MSGPTDGPEASPGEVPFRLDLEPFAGFEVGVLVDRAVYAPGETCASRSRRPTQATGSSNTTIRAGNGSS